MLPENIMRSDLLDILFDNRNKSYGAYDLRKNYGKHLIKALVMVTVLAGLMIGFLPPRDPKSGPQHSLLTLQDSIHIIQLSPQPAITVERAARRRPVRPAARSLSAISPPRIVDDNHPADSLLLIRDILPARTPVGNTAGIGNGPGISGTGPAGTQKNSGSEGNESADRIRPFETVQIMPRFPGGPDAFKKFLSRNIEQPDDLDGGEQILTKIRFVIEADGTVSDPEVIKSGRQDLDAAILRALKRMPKWAPGVQNGKNVAVYFILPVTFVGGEQ